MLDTVKLHDDFGIEIRGVDLRAVTRDHLFPQIRAMFEAHSLLLFRGQDFDEDTHRALATLFGPIEDLRDAAEGAPIERAMVSNAMTAGALVADKRLRLLDLKANFYWHTDSTFLPVPAISNVLAGYVIPSGGGATEIVSTRIGWDRLSPALKEQARGAVVRHRFTHSRRLVDEELAQLPIYTRYPEVLWRAVWRNPVNGRDALFLGAHAGGIVGREDADGMALITALMEAVTGPDAIYAHAWRPGDVLIWDQRATMHRGTPWNYEDERTLASFVSSAVEADGIASVRPRQTEPELELQ